MIIINFSFHWVINFALIINARGSYWIISSVVYGSAISRLCWIPKRNLHFFTVLSARKIRKYAFTAPIRSAFAAHNFSFGFSWKLIQQFYVFTQEQLWLVLELCDYKYIYTKRNAHSWEQIFELKRFPKLSKSAIVGISLDKWFCNFRLQNCFCEMGLGDYGLQLFSLPRKKFATLPSLFIFRNLIQIFSVS